MKRLSIIAGLLLVGCNVGWAQRGNTIYQSFASNYIPPSSLPRTYGPVTNIGQAYHEAFLVVSAQPAKTCNMGNSPASTQLLFSAGTSASTIQGIQSDNQTQIAPVGTGGNIIAATVAALPYIYITVTGIDSANCQYSLTYSGTLYPVAPAVTTYTGISNTLVAGLVNVNTTALATGGATTLIAADSGYVQHNIYQLLITNSTANQGIVLKCGTTVLQDFTGLAAGQIVNLGFSNSAYWLCPNGAITATLTNATAVDINIWYKVE